MTTPTGIEGKFCRLVLRRKEIGAKKYGTSVARNKLPLAKWIWHGLEESLDMPIYLIKAHEEALKAEKIVHCLLYHNSARTRKAARKWLEAQKGEQ